MDIPDEELSELDRKEKKKQRLLKASHDARMRAKAAKAEETAYQVHCRLWRLLLLVTIALYLNVRIDDMNMFSAFDSHNTFFFLLYFILFS